MGLASRLGKRVLLGTFPRAFWRYEEWRIGGLHEQEIGLVPILCDRSKLSLDIGANFGMYTNYVLPCSDGCVAFEPLPHLAALLRRGSFMAGGRLRVEQVALSDRSGVTQIRMPVSKVGYSTIEPANDLTGKFERSIEVRNFDVQTRSLDEYRFENVGFIKIDVEGHEGNVLKGGAATITASKPALLVEVEERHKPGAVQFVNDFLDRLGYECYFLREGLLAPFAEFALETHQNESLPRQYVRNFIFVQGPARERLQRFCREHGPLPMRQR
jgi:FkbM family methyltransferase